MLVQPFITHLPGHNQSSLTRNIDPPTVPGMSLTLRYGIEQILLCKHGNVCCYDFYYVEKQTVQDLVVINTSCIINI